MIEQCEKQKRKTNVFSTYEASLYILNYNNNNKKDFYSDILIYFHNAFITYYIFDISVLFVVTVSYRYRYISTLL